MKTFTQEEILDDIESSQDRDLHVETRTNCALSAIAKLLYNQAYAKPQRKKK